MCLCASLYYVMNRVVLFMPRTFLSQKVFPYYYNLRKFGSFFIFLYFPFIFNNNTLIYNNALNVMYTFYMFNIYLYRNKLCIYIYLYLYFLFISIHINVKYVKCIQHI